jgi:hypothetical protein
VIPSDKAIGIGQPSPIILRNIIATVLDLTVASWNAVLLKKSITSKNSEPEIARELTVAMIFEKKHRRIGNFRIHDEVVTRSTPSMPKPDGRIDIMITYSNDEDEYFGMECKRIDDGSNALTKEYVDQGVKRFVVGKYSPNHPWGAMLGFVIDGKTSNCINRVKAQLSKHKQQTQMKSGWDVEKSFGIRQNLFRTQHHQPKQENQITILHLFLSIN